MIKFSFMYPNESDKRFDFDYYKNKHMSRTIELLKTHPGFRGISVERGLSGVSPDSAPAYVAASHVTFTTREAFLEAFMPHVAELQADIPNYTDIEIVMQFSEIEVCENKD